MNIKDIRKLFPILDQEVNGTSISLFDSAATSQKPIQVIEALDQILSVSIIQMFIVVFIHLGQEQQMVMKVHVKKFVNLSMQNQRKKLSLHVERQLLLNTVAASYGRANVKEGDEIVITYMEHHSNIIPWQQVAKVNRSNIEIYSIFKKMERFHLKMYVETITI